MSHPYFAVVPRGLEAALADELRAIGATDTRPAGGGVAFDADYATACAVNLRSRLASRVLMRLDEARYRGDDDLYKLAARTPWETLIRVDRTLRVDLTAVRSPLRSLNFATLRVKDGIVDRLRKTTGTRPSIDTRDPGTRVFMFLDERTATLYLDLSGEPLFKRGWRAGPDDKGAAPLKENLAAGLLALAGWTPAVPLVDPFCGSGTIAIEAAQIAAGMAPGAGRAFGFERLKDHDETLTARLRTEAHGASSARPAGTSAAGAARPTDPAPTPPARIAASDIDPAMVAIARGNARHAGLPDDAIRFAVSDFADAAPPFDEPGMIVCNPPYGERMDARDAQGEAVDFTRFGQALKARWGGWKVCMLSGDPTLPRQLGMKERRKFPLFNGPIECRLFVFEVFDGRGPGRDA